jgi:hypothetical protein
MEKKGPPPLPPPRAPSRVNLPRIRLPDPEPVIASKPTAPAASAPATGTATAPLGPDRRFSPFTGMLAVKDKDGEGRRRPVGHEFTDEEMETAAKGYLSEQTKAHLTGIALALRDEQLEARIVHYRADLATSPELDAITANVVAELQQLQRVARDSSPNDIGTTDDAERERELIQTLDSMLRRLFRPGQLASIVERKLAEASKRFARLFFESELHDKIRGTSGELKAMRFPEQALYLALAKSDAVIKEHLSAFEYANDEVLTKAKDRLNAITRELRDAFLARTTPELNELLRHLNEVLVEFFSKELPPVVDELAAQIVRDAQLTHTKVRAGYKISADAFPRFRAAFERRFLERLISYASDAILRRVRETGERFRTETIRFVADPHIFSDICELTCDSIYDYLYNDGFLDLPGDWRMRLRRAP